LEADVDVVRDLLDKSVVDRNGHEMGRVDAILLEQDDGPLRITSLLIGPAALGSRLHPAIGRLVTRLETWLRVERDRPSRIDVGDIERIDRTIRLRITIGETTVAAIEQLLRKWIVKLPGSR
jgi:sporulation protein YlmC with PRC-barrel domain